MKTKVGQALLKYYSNQINLCNRRMIEIAQEMEKLKVTDFSAHPDGYFQSIFCEFNTLKKERDEHQAAITTMCGIEAMLNLPEPLSPKARRVEILSIQEEIANLEAGDLSELGQRRLAELKTELQKVMNG